MSPRTSAALEGGTKNVSSSFLYSPGSLCNFQNADEQLLPSQLQMALDIDMNTSVLKIYLLCADVKKPRTFVNILPLCHPNTAVILMDKVSGPSVCSLRYKSKQAPPER